MMGVFAEFERAMIRDRILAGQARARAAGTHLGRPRIPRALERKIEARLARGDSKRAIRRALGVGYATIDRVKAARAAG